MESQSAGDLLVEHVDDIWVLTLRGEQDLDAAEALNAELEAMFQPGTRLIVDLSQASFIDSTMLSRLLRARQLATTSWRGDFVVCAPTGSVARRVIRLVALEDRIPVFETREDAMRALQSADGCL